MTSLPPTACPTPDLSYLLDHTSHVLRTKMAAGLAEIGMTARMHCVLIKAIEEERTQIQIAEMGDMDKTTMVVTVDALEAAGLAERRTSSTDRRARIIAVTEKGVEVAGQSQAIVDKVHADAIGALPEEGRAVLINALTLLAEGHLAVPEESPARARRARQKSR
jgi:DNA-binding MarR family transcriptional regulator